MLRFGAVAAIAIPMALHGQPGIGQNGVVNAASNIPPTLPGGALARGAWIAIHGVRLGSPGHASVTLLRDASSTDLRILKAGPSRIDALLPESAALGSGRIVVRAEGGDSKPFPVEVVASNPGIFSRNGQGWGPGRIRNLDSSGNSENTVSHPARRGQRVVLVTTGLGNVKHVTVVIGNQPATAGPPKPTGHPGEERLSVRIPDSTPLGCYVPVYIEVTSTRASNVVTMAVHDGKRSCDVDPVPALDGKQVGVLTLLRMTTKAPRKNAPDIIGDSFNAVFVDKKRVPVFSPLPPAGTCTAYVSSFQGYTRVPNSVASIFTDFGSMNSENYDAYSAIGMDAGPLITLRRAAQTRTIKRSGEPGQYRADLGARGLGRGPAVFLDPGDLQLEVPGGTDVRPFKTEIPAPAVFEWTDREQIAVVDRQHPPTVHWHGAPGRMLLVIATNIDQITTASSTCMCVARPETGSFTIPPALLANVPASQDIPGVPYERLSLVSVQISNLRGIDSPILDGGISVGIYQIGRIVQFR